MDYYVKKHYVDDTNQQLIYKDNVYIAIFGFDEDHFYFRPDSNGNVVYYRLNDLAYRADYYSHAEGLFGQHTIIDGWDVVAAVTNLIFGIASMAFPTLGVVVSGIELAQALIFSNSIVDTTSWTVSEALESFIEKKGGKWGPILFGGAMSLLSFCLDLLGSVDQFDIMDIQLCNCLQQMKYRLIFRNGGNDVYIQQFSALNEIA